MATPSLTLEAITERLRERAMKAVGGLTAEYHRAREIVYNHPIVPWKNKIAILKEMAETRGKVLNQKAYDRYW